MKVKFEFEKETKNTTRFKEVDTNVIGTLYIQKQALQKLDYKQGECITIEISGGKENE